MLALYIKILKYSRVLLTTSMFKLKNLSICKLIECPTGLSFETISSIAVNAVERREDRHSGGFGW